MKKFVLEVAQLFTVGSDDVRFGVMQYSNNHRVEFELSDHRNIASLKKAINNIQQWTGDTYTGEALKALLPLFEKARKERSSPAPCHLIVLTDGEAHDNVKIPAEILRKAKVNIYAIGVREANGTQLLEIAGSELRVRFVNQFDALKDIKNVVVQHICSEEGKTHSQRSMLTSKPGALPSFPRTPTDLEVAESQHHKGKWGFSSLYHSCNDKVGVRRKN